MRETHPRCLCSVLTGYPDEESELIGIHLGIDDYIRKPTNADTLVALLADKISSKDAQIFQGKLRSAIQDTLD